MRHTLQPQNGVAMLAVLGVLLLGLSTVWGVFGVVQLAEGLLGYRSDYARTFAAAQSLLRDAEADIEGPRNAAPQDMSSASAPWFPQTDHEFNMLSDRLSTMPGLSRVPGVRCVKGICMPHRLGDWVGPDSNLGNLVPVGVCFAQFTRSLQRQPFNQQTLNPVLHNDSGSAAPCRTARAWYWVELFRYAADVNAENHPNAMAGPAFAPAFIYRITVLAQGMRPNTRVVLRSLYMPFAPTLPPLAVPPLIDGPRGIRMGWQQLHD
jgi:type IV pilus assembly protein PilX